MRVLELRRDVLQLQTDKLRKLSRDAFEDTVVEIPSL